MTGPDHYRKAERLLVEAATMNRGFYGSDAINEKYTQAQIHATLALAAAQAAQITGLTHEPYQRWQDAIGADAVRA